MAKTTNATSVWSTYFVAQVERGHLRRDAVQDVEDGPVTGDLRGGARRLRRLLHQRQQSGAIFALQ